MSRFAPVFGFAVLATVALSSAALARDEVPNNFRLEGTQLIFDTNSEAANFELTYEDIPHLRRALRRAPEITTLVLNSGGGFVGAADEMALIVSDFELDTMVDGECSSSCVTLFLAGEGRSMTRGSLIGFHLRSWAPDDVQEFFEFNRDVEGWSSPFEFVTWNYADTQDEVYRELQYMVERGVDPVFAISTKQMRSQMWYPTRRELRDAGVLRDHP